MLGAVAYKQQIQAITTHDNNKPKINQKNTENTKNAKKPKITNLLIKLFFWICGLTNHRKTCVFSIYDKNQKNTQKAQKVQTFLKLDQLFGLSLRIEICKFAIDIHCRKSWTFYDNSYQSQWQFLSIAICTPLSFVARANRSARAAAMAPSRANRSARDVWTNRSARTWACVGVRGRRVPYISDFTWLLVYFNLLDCIGWQIHCKRSLQGGSNLLSEIFNSTRFYFLIEFQRNLEFINFH